MDTESDPQEISLESIFSSLLLSVNQSLYGRDQLHARVVILMQPTWILRLEVSWDCKTLLFKTN